MKNKNVFNIALIIATLSAVIGAFNKINDIGDATIFLLLALVATLIYISIGIYEVSHSRKISGMAKSLWMLGFVFFSFLTGLLYMLLGRRNIV